MKIHTWLLLLALLSIGLTSACSSGGGTEDTETTDTSDADTDADSDTDTDADTDSEADTDSDTDGTDGTDSESDTVDSDSDTIDTSSDSVDTSSDTVDTSSDTVDTSSDTIDTNSDTIDTNSDTQDTDTGSDTVDTDTADPNDTDNNGCLDGDQTVVTASDLAALLPWTCIDGHLNINGTDLADITLPNLESVGMWIYIGDNANLQTIDMPALHTIGEFGLQLENNAVLSTLSSFNSLTDVNNVEIVGHPMLTSITGFNTLAAISENLTISDSDILSSIEGFGELTTVGQMMIIDNLPLLENLHGLESLVSVGINMQIKYCPSITTLDELQSLTSSGTSLTIISNNPSLPYCEICALLPQLSTIPPGNMFWTRDNLDDACGNSSTTIVDELGCIHLGCVDQPDFTLCEAGARDYDICVNERCVSPGCGSAACNTPGPHFPIPDTNQRFCYSSSGEIPCPNPGDPLFGQDSQFGWDTLHVIDDRFSRDEITMPANPVVADNVTGLMWQGCNPGRTAADCSGGSDQYFNWNAGLMYCDNLNYGGYTDWRLPDVHELLSIVSAAPTANTQYGSVFPDAGGFFTWTSTVYAGNPAWAWLVYFQYGIAGTNDITWDRAVRCVRGVPTAATATRYTTDSTVADEPIVLDNTTDLDWQACPAGLFGADCTGGARVETDFEDALTWCETSDWGGFDDWRLPDMEELSSLLNYRQFNPAIDSTVFPNTNSVEFYRTSTTSLSDWANAYLVTFTTGETSVFRKDMTVNTGLRCVRGGELNCDEDWACGNACTDCTATGGSCMNGQCAVTDCTGLDDFTSCYLDTTASEGSDRDYDICVNEICVSPGCGDISCNPPGPHFPLPDTGTFICYDATGPLGSCPASGAPFFGQDAQYGLDTLNNPADRFTRDVVTAPANPIVTDNVTGLIWQGCLGGATGSDCKLTPATTRGWAAAINWCETSEWGGFTDWRLPDPYEILTIASPEWSSGYEAAFPETTWMDSYQSFATKPEEPTQYVQPHRNGLVDYAAKANDALFRCVRGGNSTDRSLLVDSTSGDRLVTDASQGLMWQGCELGRTGTDCGTGTTSQITKWEIALLECESLDYGGYTDWRLPDLQELFSLIDFTRSGPFLDTTSFPLSTNTLTWTSTTYSPAPTHAITPRFDYTEVFPNDKGGNSPILVRCVRDI